MNIVFRSLLAILIVAVSFPTMAMANAEAGEWLDVTRTDKGLIGVHYEVKKDVLTKVRIAKANQNYTYSLYQPSSEQAAWFPLQMGDGEYEIAIFENVSGKKYRTIAVEKVSVKVSNPQDVYLNSVQIVNWLEADKAIAKAKELTAGSDSDEQKVRAIYSYIVSNIRYDYDLAKNVESDYSPNINDTLITSKGICYGYATLFAAMLRSEGIPTKLVMGTTKAVAEYHAWNEVYLNGKWIVIDPTVDAGLQQAGAKYSLAKKAYDYKALKTY